MIRPAELEKDKPLKWSPGTGIQVWDMFCAGIAGDLETIKRLVSSDGSLARCQYAYRKPLYFAVRENQLEAARFLLDHDPDPLGLAVHDMVDLLLSRGAKPNLPSDPPRARPLAWAARRGQVQVVELLKKHGAG
jgi:ankyrin repeat protein